VKAAKSEMQQLMERFGHAGMAAAAEYVWDSFQRNKT
jgi:hypothetical protein